MQPHPEKSWEFVFSDNSLFVYRSFGFFFNCCSGRHRRWRRHYANNPALLLCKRLWVLFNYLRNPLCAHTKPQRKLAWITLYTIQSYHHYHIRECTLVLCRSCIRDATCIQFPVMTTCREQNFVVSSRRKSFIL
jgi:hypothetical protein